MAEGERQDLRDKTVVVTGASSGIGAEAASRLAGLGATVAVVGRTPERTTAVAERIGARPYLVDYGRLDDVRRLAAELLSAYERIDILANNAGALYTTRAISADGHEMTFQVNHLAPFLLTNLLLPQLTDGPDGARVLNTGSNAHRHARLDLDDLEGARRSSVHRAHPASKLATILFTRELARRTQGTGVTTVAFHPGMVATDIGRNPAQAPASRQQAGERPCAGKAALGAVGQADGGCDGSIVRRPGVAVVSPPQGWG